jgi:hypothetical protein
MNELCPEMKAEIFKYVSTPIELMISNKDWYEISKESHVRGEWLIYKYERAYALFYSVRLGNHFISTEVVHVNIL